MKLHDIKNQRTPLAWFGPNKPCDDLLHGGFEYERVERTGHHDCAAQQLKVQTTYFCEHKCTEHYHYFDRAARTNPDRVWCPDCTAGECPVMP